MFLFTPHITRHTGEIGMKTLTLAALLAAATAGSIAHTTAHANDRAPSGIKASKAQAMAEYWRHPTKPQVQQVESRSLTGKKSCEVKIGAPQQTPSQSQAQGASRNNNTIIIREAVINRC
jgi:hypothetical protein